MEELLYFAGGPTCGFVVVTRFPVSDLNTRTEAVTIDENPVGVDRRCRCGVRFRHDSGSEQPPKFGNMNSARNWKLIVELADVRVFARHRQTVEFSVNA